MTNYIFIYLVDEGTRVVKECDNFAEAILKLAKYEGIDSELFKKSIRGFEVDDVNGLIALFNHFSDSTIQNVYEIYREIYSPVKKECCANNTEDHSINSADARTRCPLNLVPVQLSDEYWENEMR